MFWVYSELWEENLEDTLRPVNMYMYVVVMCMLVIVAPPIVMGAWSMAFLLGQHVGYYYHMRLIYMYMYMYMILNNS